MTLREILNEETYIKRNYYVVPDNKREKSVVSGKTILGFPGDKAIIPVSLKHKDMFDIANVGDNTYEFYVGDRKQTKDAPYKFKDCYIGTLKFDKFKDNTGVAMALINRFINSNRISDKTREWLREWYNSNCNHPYYEGYFKKI